MQAPASNSMFSPLRNRNYATYMAGQAISLIGTFMQIVAQQWYVWEVTRDAKWIGIVGALSFAPTFFLAPFAGSIADRYNRRLLVLATQIVEMLLAFLLAALIWGGMRNVYVICVFSIILGFTASINFPAQAALIGDMVGMAEVRKAASFNASVFQIGRLIGPAIAGWVVATLGTAPAFFINGVSYIAVIISLLIIRANQVRKEGGSSILGEFGEAVKFVRSQPRIIDLLLSAVLMTMTVFSATTLFAPLADITLNGGADSPKIMGYLTAASGLGALVGALFIGPRYATVSRVGVAVTIALLWSGIWLALSYFISSMFFAMLCIFCVSITLPIVLAGSNSLIQTLAPSNMRARILSVFQMITFGAQPLGTLFVGFTGNLLGPIDAITLNGGILLVGALMIWLTRKDFIAWQAERKVAPTTPQQAQH